MEKFDDLSPFLVFSTRTQNFRGLRSVITLRNIYKKKTKKKNWPAGIIGLAHAFTINRVQRHHYLNIARQTSYLQEDNAQLYAGYSHIYMYFSNTMEYITTTTTTKTKRTERNGIWLCKSMTCVVTRFGYCVVGSDTILNFVP